MSTQPLRVLCLGGGYTAIRLAKTLRRAIRQQLVDLTVVSRDNFHTFHGFVPDMLTGKVQPGQIISPARRIFPPARFINANIESIDLAESKVKISRFLDGREYELAFDHLVIALGSLDDLTRYAGIAEHALKLKTYWDCFTTRNHIISMLEMAEIEPDPAERRRLLTFVVAGGNFGGVEVATELREYLDGLVRHEYSRLSQEEIRVILVHSTPRILPELLEHHEGLVTWAERHLAKRGLEFRPNTRVDAATGDEMLLSSGEAIATRTIISCTGTAQSPLLKGLPIPRDNRGRVQTDEYVRVRGETRIWAGGDCAAVPHPKGGTCPPLAIYALTAGRQIALNILRDLRGQPLRPYRFTGIGDACSLGWRRAVAHFKGVHLTGVVAWIAWRFLLLRFVPTFDRKVRLLVDWMIWPLVGRDVVNMKVDEAFGLKREHFEPGQEIVRQGDVGQRLYLIWKGEVEVLRDGPDSAPVVVLGPGHHFGEVAIFQNARRTATVRARTPVELISLGRAEAVALSSAVGVFGDAVRRLPGESTAVAQPEPEPL